MATINMLPPNPVGFYERGVRSIMKIERTEGDGSPGTIDTHTIYYTDATTSTFQVYNGADGDGPEGLGTVTLVALSMPSAFEVAGSPITEAGTLVVTLAAGRVIPTQAQLDALAPRVATVETITGTAPELSTSGGEIKVWVLTANSSLTLSLASGEALTLHVTLGNYTLTLPSIRWPDGTEPTLHATDENVIEFWAVGSSVYGAYVGAYPALVIPDPVPE